jgi:hypothetical protein
VLVLGSNPSSSAAAVVGFSGGPIKQPWPCSHVNLISARILRRIKAWHYIPRKSRCARSSSVNQGHVLAAHGKKHVGGRAC